MRFLLALVVISFLMACGGNGRVAPVHHLGAVPHVGPRPSHYVVRKGDTLYAIGWKYGLHYRTLALWNQISSPYTIYAGQKLRLTPPSGGSAESPPAAATLPPKQEASDNKGKIKEAVPPSLAKTTPVPSKEHSASKGPARITQGIRWHWPTEGKVIQNFSPAEAGRKGMDIAGQLGQPIVAAADGKVVYSGVGLPRYGKLIIVKHDDSFLSTYAHNEVLISKEGDIVKGGQKIAEMGRSGTGRVKLHFEIRHHGKPVDPLRYLPQ